MATTGTILLFHRISADKRVLLRYSSFYNNLQKYEKSLKETRLQIKKFSLNGVVDKLLMTCVRKVGVQKKGKLIISRRYNQTPLLYSYPGGFNGS
jgi:hypothetical protein